MRTKGSCWRRYATRLRGPLATSTAEPHELACRARKAFGTGTSVKTSDLDAATADITTMQARTDGKCSRVTAADWHGG